MEKNCNRFMELVEFCCSFIFYVTKRFWHKKRTSERWNVKKWLHL